MFDSFPKDTQAFMSWTWAQIEPYYQDLAARTLDAAALEAWMADWTRLYDLLDERYARHYLATSQSTTDLRAEKKYTDFLETIFPEVEKAEQSLKLRLLESGLVPANFEVPLRKMQAEVEVFREANLPLMTAEQKMGLEYDRIQGAQTVLWQGAERTLTQMVPLTEAAERPVRERIWRLSLQRIMADREAINSLWVKFMDLRAQMAANAGFSDYRAYRWKFLKRFDYTPDDCKSFHQAIEAAVVPAARRIHERRREQLGVDRLRPWDLDLVHGVYPFNMPALRPFQQISELVQKASAMYRQLDPELGVYFDMMVAEDLLDVENRVGKAPGAYCINFPHSKRPFIFMNAVGSHDDVQTMLHESGHAFHDFEANRLPYSLQRHSGAEFSEVASMSMELLAAPFLPAAEGGFYSEPEAARARVEHLERTVLFWTYMAVVDAFQHWVYENHAEASDPANCDAAWARLWDRMIPGVDWSGLEQEKQIGWHRKLHIHQQPFYYVEYGLAQLGAVQVWRNAMHDQHTALARYREALALGGTRPLPALYQAAGARLAFDAEALQSAVALIEDTIAQLDAAQDNHA